MNPKLSPTFSSLRVPLLRRTSARIWLYRLVAVLIVPLLILTILEISLRAAGYGYPTGFFAKSKIRGQEYFTENPQFGFRFFPPSLAREPIPLVIPSPKPRDSFRVIVLGESAALGDPDYAFGFSRMLEVMLARSLPGRSIEVYNVAMTAINSHVVRIIAQDCRRLSPDLLVIYMGNNEVVGPFGAGNEFSRFARSQSLIRAVLFLKQFRLIQLLDQALALVRHEETPRSWTGMSLFMKSTVGAADPRLPVIYDHFRDNLADVCRTARRSGATALLCTIGSNLSDCSPFASVHDPHLSPRQAEEWNSLREQATSAEARGAHEDAASLYRQLCARDSLYAETRFRLARCLAQAGAHDSARAEFVRARDLDALRFRADSRINQIVREVAAADRHIILVDAEAAFAAASPHGIVGDNLFLEHVHLNFSGNLLLASRIAEKAVTVVGGGGAATVDSAECAQRLSYSPWNRAKIAGIVYERMQAPPFTNQYDHAERRAARQKSLRDAQLVCEADSFQTSLDMYEAALTQRPEDLVLRWNYGTLLQKRGHMEQATEQFAYFADRLPQSFRAQNALGLALLKLKRLEEARRRLEQALVIQPLFPEALANMGRLSALQGKAEEALQYYQKALRIRPDFTEAHNLVGLLYESQGKSREAESSYRRALEANPGDVTTHRNLAHLLLRGGRVAEAGPHLRAVLAVEPNDASAHTNLGCVMQQLGELDGAIVHYREAMRLRPDDPKYRRNLEQTVAIKGGR